MTIISLHLPKTAGTSFGVALAAHFGERYQDDYSDQVISKSLAQRHEEALAAGLSIAEHGLGKVECVHGHFLPAKYLLLSSKRELTFVTWMREPVARMFSHYHYWQESYDEATAAPHHRQVIEEGWTLERFCLSEQFRNIYAQYLWNFPLENFAFIGISECYQEDLQEFSRRYLPTKLKSQRHNATKYTDSLSAVDEAFLDKVRDFHAADIQLYQRALQWRERQRAGEIAQPHEAVSRQQVVQG
ncbi:MAG TPA: hypothetical protein VIM06_05465 [Rhodanobacter sp.]